MNRPANQLQRVFGAGLAVVSAKQLTPQSDLTFRTFDDLTVRGANVHQSLLNGSLFRNCTFEQVRFSRCDLEQVQFQKCRFIDVDFRNVEMTSTQVDQSYFQNCDFESALISDGVWRQCGIESCSFQQAVIHTSQFEKCDFKGNNFRGASIQLDSFRQSGFENMKLGDCTFLNHLLVGCSFKNVRINAESLGSLYGISMDDLLSFKLVYLGQTVVDVATTKDLLDSLEAEYEQRRWFFMHGVLRLNFGRSPRATALEDCLKAVFWPASLGSPLKSGDITFLEMIVMEMRRHRTLPALSAITIPEKIRNFISQQIAGNFERQDVLKLQQLASRLQGILLEMLQQLSRDTECLMKRDRSVTAKLIFAERPKFDVVKFLQAVSGASGLHIRDVTRALREESGSYLLVVQTTLATLAALQTALWLINGCVAEVIELKARLQVVAQKRPPKTVKDRVLLPDQNIPKWMAVSVQGIFAKLTGDTSRLHQVAADFSPGNFQRIEIGERKLCKQAKSVVSKS